MIQKLYALYKYIPEQLFEESEYDLYLQPRKEKVIVLNFSYDEENDNYEYVDSELTQYSVEKNLSQYYYKNAPANSCSPFPTIIISDKDLKDMENHYSINSKSFSKLIRILNNCVKIEIKLSGLVSFLKNQGDLIITEIQKLVQSKVDLYLLTISINKKTIGTSELFEKIRSQASSELLSPYYTDKKEIRKTEKCCSLCLKKNMEVWGYVSTFNFYAVKTDFPPIAGGFDKNETWKNYPVCPECATKLKKAKQILVKKMSYSLCGLRYFILPSFISENGMKENNEIIDIFLNEDHIGKQNIDNNTIKSITSSEKEILSLLSESNNYLCFTLFFYEENNSEFKITLSIDDIFPSQLKKVFKAKEKCEKKEIFHNLMGLNQKSIPSDMIFTFDIVREFLPINSKKNGDFTKNFLETIRAIFLQKQLNYSFILHRIMAILRKGFVNNSLYFLVLKSFMFLDFLNNLKIIDLNITNDKEVKMEDVYTVFFENHQDFFDSSIKKTVFLEGVLCQHLLDIQYQERKATPFKSQLNGMKLNDKLIKKLFPEIIEKLDQYKKNYYRKLEETIATLFINSKMTLTNDEMSYYFMLGMTLNKQFKAKEEEENDNQ